MSLRVNGVSCSTIARSSRLRTAVSSSFYVSVAPGLPHGELLAFTLDTACSGSFTVLLRCEVVSTGPDVSLGLDWKASLRELLLVQGHPVPVSFDPFESYLPSGVFFVFVFGFLSLF